MGWRRDVSADLNSSLVTDDIVIKHRIGKAAAHNHTRTSSAARANVAAQEALRAIIFVITSVTCIPLLQGSYSPSGLCFLCFFFRMARLCVSRVPIKLGRNRVPLVTTCWFSVRTAAAQWARRSSQFLPYGTMPPLFCIFASSPWSRAVFPRDFSHDS